MRTYTCRILEDWRVTLPPEMVRELDLQVGDELEFVVDDEGNVTVKVIYHDWEAPSWIQDDLDQE